MILDVGTTEYTFHLLSFDDGGLGLCPRMEKLYLTVKAGIDMLIIERMLDSRFRHNVTFRAKIGVEDWEVKERRALISASSIKRWRKEGRLKV